MSQMELPSEGESSNRVLEEFSAKAKNVDFFAPMVLSLCLCLATSFSLIRGPQLDSLYIGDVQIAAVVQGVCFSPWLVALSWDGIERPLMAIPAFLSCSLLVAFVIWVLLPNHDECGRHCRFVFWSAPMMYWLALFLGLVNIWRASRMTLRTCLLLLTVAYAACANPCLMFNRPGSGSWPQAAQTIATATELVPFCISWVGVVRWLSQMTYSFYLNLWKSLTVNMKVFLFVDLLSMVTFSIYSWLLTGPIATLISRGCLVIGWALTIFYFYDFHCAVSLTPQERDQRFQRACQISVMMDVVGKVFTYVCVALAGQSHPNQLIETLEVITTLIEALPKWEHARRAHAREVPSDGRLTNYLLGDREP